MMFFRIFTHLLPRARAWRLTADKTLRRFFQGLAGAGEDVKAYSDDAQNDLYPATTRRLDQWERQFNLPATDSIATRRERLDGIWKALGGQSPHYIQTTLQAAGFNVFVHEWWTPGTEPPLGGQFANDIRMGEPAALMGEPEVLSGNLAEAGARFCAIPRDPREVLISGTGLQFLPEISSGDPAALSGEPEMLSGNIREVGGIGYALVNKVFATKPRPVALAGNAQMQAGEQIAQAGYYVEFQDSEKVYIVPDDPTKWPYFAYIGGRDFPFVATVPLARKNEFEALCLRICPTQLWLGMLVQYV